MNKKVSRRDLLKGIGFGIGAAALAACTPAAPAATSAPQPTSAPAAGGSDAAITYWGFNGTLGKTEDDMVTMYHAAQSAVKVDRQVQGSYEETAQKLTAALAAKTAPDLALLSDVWWFKFYRAKVLMPLNDLAAGAGIDGSDFVPSLWSEGVRKGAQYWIPFARSTPLFYYNVDMFQAAGLPDRGPKTWAEFDEWAPKLLKKDGATIKTAAFAHTGAASYNAWIFQGVIWQFGGEYSTPDFKIELLAPDSIRSAQFYQDTVDKFGWAVTAKDAQKDFITGLTAATILSTGGLTGILKDAAFKVGTAFLPEEKQFGCPTGGAGLSILTGTSTEKAQAAAKFIAYATGKEGGAFWSQNTGYMPVRKSTANSDSYIKYFQTYPQTKTAVDQLPKTRPQDAARVFIPGGDQIIGKGLERIITGKENVATVWKDVTAQLDKEAEPVKKDLIALGA
ncbi:MAG: ABC transporter substrate-binding protein [Chloroflexi bacterium]|nr:ABC transporter substrate-binding protein [Chloroflexota bacterium]